MRFGDIDTFRKAHLSVAEFIDAWRLIPRLVVLLFMYGTYHVVKWYMSLAPYLLEGCVERGGTVEQCLVQAPTNQHVALITALFGLAAAVFGFYAKSGRTWNGFTHWKKTDSADTHDTDHKA